MGVWPTALLMSSRAPFIMGMPETIARASPARARRDGGKHPSAFLAVAAKRVEAELVLGAAGHVLDARVRQPERAQLGADGGAEVHERLVSDAARDEADLVGHLGSDLEAAGAYAGPDGRDDVPAPEELDARADDPGDDAAPARVDGGDVTAGGVGDENGDAVGHPHADGPFARTTDEGVGAVLSLRIAAEGGRRPVHLRHLDDGPGSEGPEEVGVRDFSRRKRMREAARLEKHRPEDGAEGLRMGGQLSRTSAMMPRADS